MKAIKRTVAALLATLMLATSTSFTLAAEEYSDAEAVAVAKVNAAQVMTGTDKGFEPSKTLTRAEAAAIMVRMKGISESTVKQSAGTTLFTDVPASHWAAGYINVASNYGIIVGVGAGLFAPDKEVSVAEFYTMAVRALEAGKLVDSEGTWPTNYVNFAIENDLAEDVAQVYSQTATRITAAIIVANTLEAKLWEKTQVKTNGEITWEAKNKTIIENVLKYVTKDSDGKALTIKPESNISNIDKEIDGVEVADYVDLSNIKLGMTYEYWLNEDEEIAGLWIPTSTDYVEFTEIKDFKYVSSTKKAEVTFVVDGKSKTYKIDTTFDTTTSKFTKLPTIVENEEPVEIDNASIAAIDSDDKVQLAEKLADDKNVRGIVYVDENVVKQIYLTKFYNYSVVKEATAKKVTYKDHDTDHVGFTNGSLSLTKDDFEYFLTKDGKAMSFSDLKEDDVIRYYTITGKKIVAEVVEPTVSGEVKSIRNKATNKLASIKIDGTSYDVTNEAWTIKAEDEITIYLNDAGKVVAYIKDKETAESSAVIVYARKVTEKYGDNLEVKLLLTDGTVTDTMVIDIDESEKELELESTITGNTIVFNSTYTYALGSACNYDIKNGKVVFKKLSANEDAEYGSFKTTKTGNPAAYIEKSAAKGAGNDYAELVVGSKNISLNIVKGKATDEFDTIKAYVTDSTKVFNLKRLSASASNYDYELKFEEVDSADLDDMYKICGTIIGYDNDTKEIEYLFLAPETTVARTSETNFAFITKVWETKEDDEDVKEIEVILMDGSKETYIVNDETTGSDLAVAGNFVDLAVKGDKALELDDLDIDTTGNYDDDLEEYTLGDNNYIRKLITSSRLALTKDGSDCNTEVLLADDVLVLEVNTKGDKWTVRELSDIESYSDVAEFGASNELDTLMKVVTYQADASDDEEVVLVIFKANVDVQP